MQGHDPRFGSRSYTPPPPAHAGQSGQPVYGQQPGGYVPYSQPPAAPVQAQGHAPQAYGSQGYAPPAYAPQGYAQPPHAPQAQSHAAHAPQAHAPMFGGHGHMPSMGGLGGALGGALGGMAGKQPSGLPAMLSFPLGLAAVVVALVFDVIFLKIHIPGVGSYAWYLTTALSFAGAGWASIKWTKASKTVAMTALGVAAALYGVADLGLGLVLEDLSMGGAIMLGAQGVAIALFTGFGGVFKAMRDREE